MSEAHSLVSSLVCKQTFKERVIGLGLWKKGKRGKNIPLDDILTGKIKHAHSSRLRKRLIAEKIKQEKCEYCNMTHWLGQKLPLTLHHIDGNSGNNKLDNLQILCYNCHATTENFSGLNKKF